MSKLTLEEINKLTLGEIKSILKVDDSCSVRDLLRKFLLQFCQPLKIRRPNGVVEPMLIDEMMEFLETGHILGKSYVLKKA